MNKQISQKSFDELQKILDVSVDENIYNRWVKNGFIRIVDICDVLTDVPSRAVIDWRSDGDEINNEILRIAGYDPELDGYDALKNHIIEFNNSGSGFKYIIFGQSWDDSDSVELYYLNDRSVQNIFDNNELKSLFLKV